MKNWIYRLVLSFMLLSIAQLPVFSQVIDQKLKAPVKTSGPDSAPPAENYVWIPGEWKWNKKKKRYAWLTGYWTPKRPGYVFIEGRWKTLAKKQYEWIPGAWTEVQNAF